MIAVDTNLLVHAHREDSEWFAAAEAVVRGLAEGRASWAIPWPCIHEFFAIATHRRIYAAPPTPTSRAIEQIDAWLQSPSLVLLGEGPAHWQILTELIRRAKLAGPQIHDARIAAICMQHDVRELWSADRDLARFPALTVRNPLLA